MVIKDLTLGILLEISIKGNDSWQIFHLLLLILISKDNQNKNLLLFYIMDVILVRGVSTKWFLLTTYQFSKKTVLVILYYFRIRLIACLFWSHVYKSSHFIIDLLMQTNWTIFMFYTEPEIDYLQIKGLRRGSIF